MSSDLFDRYRVEDENKNKRAHANSLVEDRWAAILGEDTLASDLTIGHVTAQQAAWLKEGLAGSSINRYCARLRRVLQQATRDGLLRFNPVLGYPQLREPPARHRRLELDEEERLRKIMDPNHGVSSFPKPTLYGL